MSNRSILREVFLQPAMAPLLIGGCLFIYFHLFIYLSLAMSGRGKAYDSMEVGGSTFGIRATAYHERWGNPFLPGAYIVFESTPVNSIDWWEVEEYYVNDSIRIPRWFLRLVNDQVGYIYTHRTLRVTVDGGLTWSKWQPEFSLPNGDRILGSIEHIDIGTDGRGQLRAGSYDSQQRKMITMCVETKDYGQNWK